MALNFDPNFKNSNMRCRKFLPAQGPAEDETSEKHRLRRTRVPGGVSAGLGRMLQQ